MAVRIASSRNAAPGVEGINFGVGTFTVTAAGVTTITDAGVTAGSQIMCFPTNGPGGLLLKGKSCFVTPTVGSFTFNVSATGAGAPAGTETFGYLTFDEGT